MVSTLYGLVGHHAKAMAISMDLVLFCFYTILHWEPFSQDFGVCLGELGLNQPKDYL